MKLRTMDVLALLFLIAVLIFPASGGDFIKPVNGRISQEFSNSHPGVDIAAPCGSTTVYASASGSVEDTRTGSYRGDTAAYGAGNYIVIKHNLGNIIYYTKYMHLDSVNANLGIGTTIYQGQPIGKVGNTGNTVGSNGCHLHYELRKNSRYGPALNPQNYWGNTEFQGQDNPVGTQLNPLANPPSINSPGSSSEPGNSIDALSPTFKWSGDSNADYYALYISKYPYGSANIIFDSAINAGPLYGTSFNLPSGYLQVGMKYRWNMKAHSSAGWSSISNTLYFQIQEASKDHEPKANPPSINSPGSSSEPGNSIDALSPTFKWSGDSNADYYALYISKYPYGSANIIFDSAINAGPLYGTSFNLPSGYLQVGMKYRWNMKTHSSAGWSSISNTLYFQTAAITPTQDKNLQQCWKGGQLSQSELASIVKNNFPSGIISKTGENIQVVAYAVARAESRGNPTACGDCGKTICSDSDNPSTSSIGLWQINLYWHSGYDRSWLFDPNNNAQAALQISNSGQDWQWWSTYKDGTSYQQWIPEAQSALGLAAANELDGQSKPSMEIQQNILNPPALVSPGSSSEPGVSTNTLSPTFEWSGVSNADYYALYISKYPYGTANIVFDSSNNYGQLSGNSLNLPSGYLQEGMKYRWNMKAHSGSGWSSISNTLYFQTPIIGQSATGEKFQANQNSGPEQNDAEYWAKNAYGLMSQHRWEEALQALEKSIAMNQGNSEVWRNKGVALYFLGRYQEAIQATEKAIEIDPSNANAISQRDRYIQQLPSITQGGQETQPEPQLTEPTPQPEPEQVMSQPEPQLTEPTPQPEPEQVMSQPEPQPAEPTPQPEPEQAISQPEPQQASVDISVERGGVAGRVMISGAQVTVQDGAGNSIQGTTDGNGHVTITGTCGNWQYSASAPGYATSPTMSATISSASVNSIRIFLQKEE